MCPKLTKSPLRKGRLQDIPDSDIHSSSYEESDFSDSETDSYAEL